MAFLDHWLWAADQQADAVAQIDPASDTLIRTIPVGRKPTSIAAGFGSLWVACEDGP